MKSIHRLRCGMQFTHPSTTMAVWGVYCEGRKASHSSYAYIISQTNQKIYTMLLKGKVLNRYIKTQKLQIQLSAFYDILLLEL